ncbi:MAG: ATP-binding protein [Vicinamibacterales bacterium]
MARKTGVPATARSAHGVTLRAPSAASDAAQPGRRRPRSGVAQPLATAPHRAPNPDPWVHREELLEDWNKYFDLFTWAPVGYLLLDLHGMVLEINHAAATLLGTKGGKVTHHPLIVFVANGDRTRLLEHMRQVRATIETVREELTINSRDGRTVQVRVSTRRSPKLGDSTCWMALEDVTDYQRLVHEQQVADAKRVEAERDQIAHRTRSEAKDQFLATLSHELRTPLTPALLASSMLPRVETLTPDGAQMVATIRRNIETEARLIDDLLDVTRIAQGKLHLQLGELDLHEILAASVAVCAPDADARGVRLSIVPAATERAITGDAGRLEQVFWNLAKNAIKFSPTGGTVRIETSNPAWGTVRVTVTDDGIGIDPSLLSRIFLPFEQASAMRKHDGLGLGLPIAKGIVEAHGGQIQAVSAGVGLGATFVVDLGLRAGRRETPGDPETGAISDVPVVHTGLNILLVEDHADSAEMLTMLLDAEGHHVETVASVSAALARLHEPWDCLISDMGLPDGSGLDVGNALKRLARPPQLSIALSGYGAPRDIANSRSAGFDAHLIKPVDITHLNQLLEPIRHR